jgi:hypothetical protein
MQDDRRISPRYSYTQSVELRGLDGARFEARSSDISAVGMSLLMAREVVVALAQGGSILTTGDRFQLLLPGTLNLSLEGGLTLDCRVRHVRRLSRDEYQVGAWFLDPTSGQQAGLEALVQSAKPRIFR